MNDATLPLGLKTPAPEVNPAEVEMVVKVLRSGAGWLTAREIAAGLGMGEFAVAERKVRKIASVAAPRIVSFPGSPGYKLWELCTVAEIDHCIEAFESQGRDMLERAILYRQAYHRRFRGGSLGAVNGALNLSQGDLAPGSEKSPNLCQSLGSSGSKSPNPAPPAAGGSAALAAEGDSGFFSPAPGFSG